MPAEGAAGKTHPGFSWRKGNTPVADSPGQIAEQYRHQALPEIELPEIGTTGGTPSSSIISARATEPLNNDEL